MDDGTPETFDVARYLGVAAEDEFNGLGDRSSEKTAAVDYDDDFDNSMTDVGR